MFGVFAALPSFNNDAHGRVAPTEFNGAFKGKGRGRTHSFSDERAFRKRISKRRAKKGYK